MKHHPNSRRHGFTLMEVLLVLGIMGIIMAMVVPRLLGRQQLASIDTTYGSIEGITQALRLYSLDHHGRYPTTADSLQVLVSRPSNSDSKWRGPYLERTPQDAWGNDFDYRSPGVHLKDTFDISSAGPDGIPGSDDDITNWDIR
ncbi:MAG: type II secretion system major pseudopilin GspG [Fuerstiella sp.]|nr:type II secretion system major pseudopilin GspG [Fuerstiella sp.]